MERNTTEPESLRLTPRCGAKRRDGLPCQKPRAKGRTRCRLHGGAPGSGAPKGEANGRYSHGLEGWRGLPVDWVVEVIIQEGRTPVGEHSDPLDIGKASFSGGSGRCLRTQMPLRPKDPGSTA